MLNRRIFSRRGWNSIRRGVRAYISRHGVSLRWLHSLRMFYRLRMLLILRLQRRMPHVIRRREARLYVDGTEAFERIEELLQSARHTVIIHMFIWIDDETGRRVASRVVEAADRGVSVQVIKDAGGDIFELNQDFLSTRHSSRAVWQRFWHHSNIAVEMPAQRDHTKVYVIDDEILLLGGMNISDQYRYDWHDFLVELRGRRFVEEYLSAAPSRHREDRVRLVMNAGSRFDVREELMRFLASARNEIILEQAYFSDVVVVDLLAQMTWKNVHVRVIVPVRPDIHHSSNTVAQAALVEKSNPAYLQMFQYPGMLHGKLVLVDRERAFIGSANIMASSLDDTGEVNVLLSGRNSTVLRRAREVVRSDLIRSTPMVAAPRLRWLTRVMAYVGL